MTGPSPIPRNLALRFRRKLSGACNTWVLRARREVTPAIWDGAKTTIAGDRDTIRRTISELGAIYHYATLEASVARILADRGRRDVRRAVDIGSGAGHWVNFLIRHFPTIESITCQELSAGRCEFLRRRFASDARVAVAQGRAEDVAMTGEVDLVNLIGVGFHIVDDAAMARLLETCARHLSADGIVLVNDLLPVVSHGNQFARHDGKVYCYKFVRSKRRWRALAARAGLRCTFYRDFAWVRAPEPIPEGHFACLHR